MKKPEVFVLIVLLLTGCATNSQKIPVDVTTVKFLDLQKYMGVWYETARFDHRFERGLTGVTATYSLLPNGKIQVVNAGYKESLQGKFTSAKAMAKLPNPSEPGKLKVFFVPFFGADYFVLDLDTDYQWVLVGSSSPNYLWILSRNKTMEPETYEMLLNRLKSRGYDIEKLIKVIQK
ncbi:MAG: lipocalin family protein [Salinivirgaceae bacterium]